MTSSVGYEYCDHAISYLSKTHDSLYSPIQLESDQDLPHDDDEEGGTGATAEK